MSPLAIAARFWYVLAIAALVALLGASHLQTQRVKTKAAEYRATVERNIRQAGEAARLLESSRQTNVDREVTNAQPKIAEERRDADTVRSDDSVRRAATAAAGRACTNTRPAAPSAPAGDPIGVLADVLGRADARAGRLAEIAGERGAAGALCEAAYDAMKAAQ